MGQQRAKIVDLTKSYLPIDPQAFPENLSHTAKEDDPEKGIPIICYEGYNFLPTSYGYRSFFGTNTALTLNALPTLCDKVIIFQSAAYENMCIAFCSDGIYTARASSTVWTKILSLVDTWVASGIYSQYTFCTLENKLYIYRQGHSAVLQINDDLTNTTFVPSFLNMAGQMGIFRANGRLAFWDSENSVAWSSAFDMTDFTPSIENMVGNATFFGVLGRIVAILPHGEGYIIYATKSVVGVSYSGSTTTVWDAMVITSISGIAHPGAVTIGTNIKEHFVYTTNGIAKVGHFNALSRQYEVEYILPELYDFLKESRDPVFLECHAARFLHFNLIDAAYIGGRTSFTDVEYPSLDAPLVAIDTSLWSTYAALPYLDPKETFQFLDSLLWAGAGVGSIDRAAASFDVPRYCVLMTTPNIPTQALSLGLLERGTTFFKHPTPALTYPTASELIEEAFRLNSTAGVGSHLQYGTSAIFLALFKNIEDTKAEVTFSSSRMLAPELSYYPELYPQDLGIAAHGHNSVLELLYNFMGCVAEYEKFAQDEYERLVALANEITTESFYTRYVYSDQTFSVDSTQASTIEYFPVSGINVSAHVQGTTEASMMLDISACIKDYVKLTTEYCSRNLVGITTVPLIEAPHYYRAAMGTSWGLGIIDFTAYVIFDHAPTVAEIIEAFSDPAAYQTEATTGHKWRMYFDAAEKPAGIGSLYTTYGGNYTYCRAENLTTGAKAFRVLKMDSMNYGINPLSQTLVSAYAAVTPTAYITEGYTLLAPISYFTFGNAYFGTTDSAAILMGWSFFIQNSTPNKGFTPFASATSYEISNTLPVDIEYKADGGIILKANVRVAGSGSDYSLRGILAFLPLTCKRYEIVEELVVGLAPYDFNALPSDANHKDGVEFIFKVAQTGVDTLTRQEDDTYTRVNKSTRLTPIVTDPGPSLPLVLSGGDIYWSLASTSKPINNANCIPWRIQNTANGGGGYIIQGQHFMAHGAGLMLTKEMPLGPIYGLDDSANACYPAMDWDGWIYSDRSLFTYPAATYTLQDGIPIPGYPTFTGSLVFDSQLKKWGKQKNAFKALVEFSPLNSTDNAIVPYSNFGMDSGVLKPDGKLYLFSQNDTDTFMRYGKYGLYRLGFSQVLEVVLHFRTPSTGSVVVDGSIDARDIDTGIQVTQSFTEARSITVYPDINARWHTVSILGEFDLQFLEIRGNIASRR